MVVKHTNILKKIGFFILVISIILFSIFPFIQMLSTSLKYQWDWGNPSLIPTMINLDSYIELLGLNQEELEVPDSIKKLLENPELSEESKENILKNYRNTGDVFPFLKYFRNSFILSFFAALISIVLSIFGAYSFTRLEYRGRSVIRRGVLFVYMFGGILLLIPLYQMAVKSGLASTELGTGITLVIIYMVLVLPVSLYMLGNYFRTIPYSLEESAMLEGCTRTKAIIKIVIPLSMPAISTIFIYAFMIAWNEYLFASVFLKSYPDIYTLPFGLNTLFTSKNAIWDRIMAASVLTATPIICLFMVIQKNLVKGLTEGSSK
jgi:multiple sugar transport system permease protein